MRAACEQQTRTARTGGELDRADVRDARVPVESDGLLVHRLLGLQRSALLACLLACLLAINLHNSERFKMVGTSTPIVVEFQ